MGVFGEFNVSIANAIKSQDPLLVQKQHHLSLPEHISYSNTMSQLSHHNANQKVFQTPAIIDRGSMISIQDNVDVLNQGNSPRKLSLSKIKIQPIVTSATADISLTQFDKGGKKTYNTTTNRSRISKLTTVNNQQKPYITGEAHFSRPQLTAVKGFLTNEELRLGNQTHISSIDRNISKLHDLSYKNWNIVDLKKSIYPSPSNFSRVYSKDPKERLKKALALNSVLENVIRD